jgi:hypothetical protein
MSQELEDVFIELVEKSWKRHNEQLENRKMDDLMIGGVITAMVEDGYALIDLSSDGVAHYLRFENIEGEKERLIFRLKNMSEDLITAKVLGRHAHIVIGYGEQVKNVGKLWETVKSEVKSGFLDTDEPGAITTDADLTSGYIYAQVPLLMDLDVYFGDSYEVKYEILRQHIKAAVHALGKYLQGRIEQA